MIGKELSDWLTTASRCLPGVLTGRLRKRAAELDAAAGGGRWEAGLWSGPALDRVTLSLYAAGADAQLRSAAALLLGSGAKPPRAAAPGIPWLELDWSLAKDEPLGAWVAGFDASNQTRARVVAASGKERAVGRTPFSLRALGGGEAASFVADFANLCPVESLRLEWRRDHQGCLCPAPVWGLRLARPEPWPRFVRANLADPLIPHASALAFLMEDRPVREVRFEEGALCALVGQ